MSDGLRAVRLVGKAGLDTESNWNDFVQASVWELSSNTNPFNSPLSAPTDPRRRVRDDDARPPAYTAPNSWLFA